MAKSRNLFNSLTARIVGLTVLVAVIATAVTASIAFPLISQGAQAQAESELNRVADVSQAALRSPVDTEAVKKWKQKRIKSIKSKNRFTKMVRRVLYGN